MSIFWLLPALACGFIFFKSKNNGQPYSPYFAALNTLLRHHAPGRPLLVLDKTRLLENCRRVNASLDPKKEFRLVAKSLASVPLLKLLMQEFGTQKLMVFHQPHLNQLALSFPQADILIGKPLPVASARFFYQQHEENIKNIKNTAGEKTFNAATQLHWLIDSAERLHEYHALAQSLQVKVRIVIEIDIGLHRGGIEQPQALIHLLNIMAADAEHLQFAGLMGYDAHVGKIPALIERRSTSFNLACAQYQRMIDVVYAHQPHLKNQPLIFNGAGSPTFRLHTQTSPLNEVAAGSCLVKPCDFDSDLLMDLTPAAFIATPVLKKLTQTRIPGLKKINAVFSALNPNRQCSYFIYGGLWRARYEAPQGLQDNALYGKSSNQAMVNGSARTALQVNDYIFMRPTQSECVLQEFGDIAVVENGEISEWWPVLPL